MLCPNPPPTPFKSYRLKHPSYKMCCEKGILLQGILMENRLNPIFFWQFKGAKKFCEVSQHVLWTRTSVFPWIMPTTKLEQLFYVWEKGILLKGFLMENRLNPIFLTIKGRKKFSIRIICNNISFPQALEELPQLCGGQISRANTYPSP